MLAQGTPLVHCEQVMWAVPVDGSDPEIPGTQQLSEQLQKLVSDPGSNLNTREAHKFEKLIIEFQAICITKSSGYGWINRVYHHTETGDAVRSVSPPQQAEVCQLLKYMKGQREVEELDIP